MVTLALSDRRLTLHLTAQEQKRGCNKSKARELRGWSAQRFASGLGSRSTQFVTTVSVVVVTCVGPAMRR